MANDSFFVLKENLDRYKRKYYLNILLRGLIFCLAIITITYLLVNVAEYYGKFNKVIRAFLLYSVTGLIVFVVGVYIVRPLWLLFQSAKSMTDEAVARQVSVLIPEVKDKLLNALQLAGMSHVENSLVHAGLRQKINELSVFNFSEGIDLGKNKRFLPWLVWPAGVLLAMFLVVPGLFMDSTARIVRYQQYQDGAAPFTFVVDADALKTFEGEDIEVKLSLQGAVLPDEAFLLLNGIKQKMTSIGDHTFTYTIASPGKDLSLVFEAGGYQSANYDLKVIAKPGVTDFNVSLDYPAYTGKKDEKLINTGNVVVPEGTKIVWTFSTKATDSIFVLSNNTTTVSLLKNGGSFEYSHTAKSSMEIVVKLINKLIDKDEILKLYAEVIRDEYPTIEVADIKDTLLYKYVYIQGFAADDYGLSSMALRYRVIKKDDKKRDGAYKNVRIPVTVNKLTEGININWKTDTLGLTPGDYVEYYIAVWDNDGVNGAKMTKSRTMALHVPDASELTADISKTNKSTGNNMQTLLDESMALKKELEKLVEKLRTNKQLTWQEKRQISENIEKHKQLIQQYEELLKQNELNNERQNILPNTDPETQQKMDELQKLMDELMDEETKKLLEDIEKMLEQKNNEKQLLNQLEQLENKDEYLNKNLDRTMELFKQMQLEQKLENNISELEQLAKDQEALNKELENGTTNSEELKNKQDELNQRFDSLQKHMEEMEQMNNDLKDPHEMESFDEEMQSIDQQMNNSSQQLQQNQQKKAGESQKNAQQQMQDMQQQMQQMQQQMQEEQQMEDMNNLRSLLENLIKLSFHQEGLMKEFKNVQAGSPKYLKMSKEQLSLAEDMKMVEDSLYALAGRVIQIDKYVTDELQKLNYNMGQGMEQIKERRPTLAAVNQQYVMTGMNNLALLLDNVLDQMQQQMAMMQQQPKDGNGKQCKNPNQPMNAPGSLNKMQQQLNEQLQNLMKSGKTGQQQSEEVIKILRQQQMIRQAMQEWMKNNPGNKGGGDMKNLLNEMEKSEQDLINRNLTEDLIKRQKDIQIRLLEAENAMKEQDEDNKREAEQAKKKFSDMPPELKKYLEEKKKQTELLQTNSPIYTPYFRKRISEYFKAISH